MLLDLQVNRAFENHQETMSYLKASAERWSNELLQDFWDMSLKGGGNCQDHSQ